MRMANISELETLKEEIRLLKALTSSIISWISANFGIDISYKERNIQNEDTNKNKESTQNKLGASVQRSVGVDLTNATSTFKQGQDVINSPNLTIPHSSKSYYGISREANNEGGIIETDSKIGKAIYSSFSSTQQPQSNADQVVFASSSSRKDDDKSFEKSIAESNTISPISFYPKDRPKRKRKPKPQKPTSCEESASSEGPIQCEICGKFLNSSIAMKRHLVTHKNSRPFVCSECGKAFQRNFHLKTHKLIHSGEKKHQCRFCGRLFLLPKDLTCHERTHTLEKPFSCSLCPRKFNLKSHLVMHIRIHTGEKPYKCDMCDKCFSQANSLRVHKKTHLKSQDIEPSTTSSTPIAMNSTFNRSTNDHTLISNALQNQNISTVTSSTSNSHSISNDYNLMTQHQHHSGSQLVTIYEPGQIIEFTNPTNIDSNSLVVFRGQ